MVDDSERSDASLLGAIAAEGDREAFGMLYRRFAPRVTALLLRRNASPAIAAEIAQEVMLTVWRRAAVFDRNRASAASWIFTITRNRYIDRLRRERRPEIDPDDPALVRLERAPDSWVDAERRAREIRAAIERLPPEQARLIRLAYLDGQSHRAIAESLGLPLGTVKSRFRLAMKKLRALLPPLEDVA